MAVFTKDQKVGNYTVQSLIKQNLYTESYRVEDEEGHPFFLKLFVLKRVPEKLINANTGDVLEVEYSKLLRHKNIISYVDSGIFDSQHEGSCPYYLTTYFTGELLVERIKREGHLQSEEAMTIYCAILDGLQYMHSLGLYHNDITPRNILLSATTNGTPEIIDLGHISQVCSGRVSFDVSDLELFYSANETFGGLYDAGSDVFAATAVLYAMLTGKQPWYMEFSESSKRAFRIMQLKDKRRNEPLNLDDYDFDEKIKTILRKGLAASYQDRYRSVLGVLNDINSDAPADDNHEQQSSPRREEHAPSSSHHQQQAAAEEDSEFEVMRGNGHGFEDIAGMQELKDYLSQKIIYVVKNKELMSKYRVTPPNGILLYGPPGCGKTFVAEKFAEETGFNFMLIKSSDLASVYVHGSQEKIGKLFRKAAKHAPIVLCFDEFDALVPDRSSVEARYTSSEVNEFLSQLNNCAKKGIFVIGTSNRPDKIDPAVLRTGRIDKQVFVPMPDQEARRELFHIHLKGRPYDENKVNLDNLAQKTEGYIASDIAYIVNDAAMTAAFTNQEITQELLETSLNNTHPSLRPDTHKLYEEIRRKMDTTERQNLTRRVGY